MIEDVESEIISILNIFSAQHSKDMETLTNKIASDLSSTSKLQSQIRKETESLEFDMRATERRIDSLSAVTITNPNEDNKSGRSGRPSSSSKRVSPLQGRRKVGSEIYAPHRPKKSASAPTTSGSTSSPFFSDSFISPPPVNKPRSTSSD